VESRRHDAEQYAESRPLFELIAGLGPQQRVAIPAYPLGAPAPPPFVIASPPFEAHRYRVAAEFEALFQPTRVAELRSDPRRIYLPRLGQFGVVDAKPAWSSR
jgi:hypothetical protein